MKDDLLNRNNFIDDDTQQMVWLCEERGLAANTWKKEIDLIVKYISDFIKSEYITHNKNEINFIVPQKISNTIDFFDGVKINVQSKLNDSVGSGSFGSENTPLFNDKTNKLINCVIVIECGFDSNGKLNTSTFLPSLYHEINHAYHVYTAMLNSGSYSDYNKSLKKAIVTTHNVNDILIRHPVLAKIIYRLFSETEFNAFVTNFYGELKAKNIDRKHLNYEIHKLNSYKEYKNILDNYVDEINSLTLDECKRLYIEFIANGIIPKLHGYKTVKNFKTVLKNKTKNLLLKLIKKIGKVSSLWFDEKEEIESKNEGLISDKAYKIKNDYN